MPNYNENKEPVSSCKNCFKNIYLKKQVCNHCKEPVCNNCSIVNMAIGHIVSFCPQCAAQMNEQFCKTFIGVGETNLDIEKNFSSWRKISESVKVSLKELEEEKKAKGEKASRIILTGASYTDSIPAESSSNQTQEEPTVIENPTTEEEAAAFLSSFCEEEDSDEELEEDFLIEEIPEVTDPGDSRENPLVIDDDDVIMID